MGHTHYNEVANDGVTIYTATRSTGQIEEGPVGFSITNLDDGVISWRFKALGEWPFVMITSPADQRFLTANSAPGFGQNKAMKVHVKAWSDSMLLRGHIAIRIRKIALQRTPDSARWHADVPSDLLSHEPFQVTAHFVDESGKSGEDTIRVAHYQQLENRLREALDKDNVVLHWPEHGTLGTQLGPNKNGRKW